MMKLLGQYWRVLLAVVLLLAAVAVYFNMYMTEKDAYDAEHKQLNTIISALQNNISQNIKYADIQDQLEAAEKRIEESRLDLYEKFPVEMKEEDQIMYVRHLEKLFGTEIQFAFSKAQPITALRDGSQLMGLTLTVNYQTSYKGFKDMINTLATDSRVTSVQYASINYDKSTDRATGTVTLLLYLIDTDLRDYLPPEVNVPDTGKDNPYK